MRLFELRKRSSAAPGTLKSRMIVWLASFPRSGNTLLRLLLHRFYGRATYSLYDENSDLAAFAGSAGRVTEPQLEGLRRRRDVTFVKTHGQPIDDSPALCLIRDGRDALVSYAHFARTYEPAIARRYTFDEVLRMLTESRVHYGGWSGNVRSWYEQSTRGPTVWLRYEDLVGEPLGQLDAALKTLDVDLGPRLAGKLRFDDLHNRWPKFFRTGRPGAWLREMNNELHELFWRHHEAPMDWFGYERSGTLKTNKAV
jgi:hypothetical protein